ALPLAPIAAQGSGSQKAEATDITRLNAVLADPRRDGDRARDRHRHPAETLAFFQVEPGMTVVDYVPAEGWYARIIAPYLGPNGRYIAMGPNVIGAAERQQ